MVEAARATGRVVQVGLHRHIGPHHVSAMQFLREGRVGKVGMVRAFAHYGGGAGRVAPDSEPPEGLNWDMWCGPAPLRPYNPNIHPGGWRHYLDFGNGQAADWGVHWMDQVLWWTEEKYPKSVHSTGGLYIRRDGSDAPDTQVVNFEFESFTAAWEHRHYAANNAEKHNVGCYFYGTKGTLHIGWYDGWTFYPADDDEPPVHEDNQLHEPDGQNIKELWDDFLRCIETRERPVCDIENGYHSTNACLLGMVSLKLGRSVRWDGANHRVVDDPDANKLLRRDYRAPWVYPETSA
jgi:predicted dehydrogenase